MMDAILVLSTVDSVELGRELAGSLVKAGLAACVNIIPNIRSIYRWEGRVCDERELLLVIKTRRGLFEAVRALIRQLHTYQVPEIIAVPVCGGDPDYLSWLAEQTGQR
ncbi:MAG: divalent-cation tolerance protein CutA [Acidobacteria bacterium]|nr:divalent-cation tolerance protein CutA [Acidobacteriota bacterium]